MSYTYFVSYRHTSGIGMIEIIRKKEIKTFDDLIELAQFIKEKNSLEGVVILNWKLLSSSEP